MLRQCLLFVAATALAVCAALVDGSTAVVAGFSRMAVVLLLFVPVLNASAKILRGPPPI